MSNAYINHFCIYKIYENPEKNIIASCHNIMHKMRSSNLQMFINQLVLDYGNYFIKRLLWSNYILVLINTKTTYGWSTQIHDSLKCKKVAVLCNPNIIMRVLLNGYGLITESDNDDFSSAVESYLPTNVNVQDLSIKLVPIEKNYSVSKNVNGFEYISIH